MNHSEIVAALNKVIEQTNRNTQDILSLDHLFRESLACRTWRAFKRRVILGQGLPPAAALEVLDQPPRRTPQSVTYHDHAG